MKAKVTDVEVPAISRALRFLRTTNGFEIKQIVEQGNFSSSHLSEVERGVKPPNSRVIKAYSNVFQIPVSNIWMLAELIESQGTQQSFCTQETAGLINIIRKKFNNQRKLKT